MNETEQTQSSHEADVDALLRDFFSREMPASLKALPTANRPATRAGRSGRNGSHNRARGAMSVSVVAGCLLLAAAALVLQAPDSTPAAARFLSSAADEQPHAATGAEDAAAASSLAAPNRTGLSESGSMKGVAPVERLGTVDGPVELRSRQGVNNVSIYDPETGATFDLMLPELEIEIFPIEEDEPDDGRAKSGAQADRKPRGPLERPDDGPTTNDER